MQTGAVTMGNNMEYPLKNKKMGFPFDPEVPCLGIYSKNPELSIQKKIDIYPYVHRSSIYNSPDLETA